LTRHRAFLVLAGFGIALVIALPIGLRQHVGGDFHVFWQAGRNFANGAPLYHDALPGARQFKYPPFAAMVFTPLSLFSLPVAGVLMSVLNLGLWVLAVALTRDILVRTSPDRRPATAPLALAVVLSAQFFLDNFHHVQMNEVTLVLALLGIRAYLGGHDLGAATAFAAATALKVTPIFFTAWLVIRGRRRAAIAVFPLALACLLLPLALRGPSRGAAELDEYYHTFLEKHQHGEIDSYTAGQNIAGLVSRMTRGTATPGEDSFRWAPAGAHTAQRVYQVLWGAVLLLFLGKVVILRMHRAPISALEVAMIFAAALLLSPITFMAHLVPLLFVFAAVWSVRARAWGGPAWVVAAAIALGMAVCGLSGRDLAGSAMYEATRGYSACAWTLLALFGVTLVLAGPPKAA
jgi:Glycosyltransferase family 87